MKISKTLFFGLIILAAGCAFFAGDTLGTRAATDLSITKLQFDTVAAGVCTIEGGGKTFMVIDVTKEMSGEPTPEEVEGPKEVE